MFHVKHKSALLTFVSRETLSRYGTIFASPGDGAVPPSTGPRGWEIPVRTNAPAVCRRELARRLRSDGADAPVAGCAVHHRPICACRAVNSLPKGSEFLAQQRFRPDSAPPTRHGRTCPLLSGLDRLDRVQGVGTGGLPAHAPGRDTACGPPAASSFPAVVPGSPGVTPDLFRGPGLPRTTIRGKPGEGGAGRSGPRNKSGVTTRRRRRSRSWAWSLPQSLNRTATGFASAVRFRLRRRGSRHSSWSAEADHPRFVFPVYPLDTTGRTGMMAGWTFSLSSSLPDFFRYWRAAQSV